MWIIKLVTWSLIVKLKGFGLDQEQFALAKGKQKILTKSCKKNFYEIANNLDCGVKES